jgi:hypothetical protein
MLVKARGLVWQLALCPFGYRNQKSVKSTFPSLTLHLYMGIEGIQTKLSSYKIKKNGDLVQPSHYTKILGKVISNLFLEFVLREEADFGEPQ